MVADYLISEGHADTIEEARYVINQMEVDDITEILNEIIQWIQQDTLTEGVLGRLAKRVIKPAVRWISKVRIRES